MSTYLWDTTLAAIVACASLLPAQQLPKPADDKPTPPKPSFVIADVHIVHLRGRNNAGRFSGIYGDHYEVEGASMLDFVRNAYGVQTEKIYGGPFWLEMTRYSVSAKVPAHTSDADARLMLQSLLEQRFSLKTHEEDKPLSTLVLTAGKSLKLKVGDNSLGTGCKPQSAPASLSGPGTVNFVTGDGNGGMTTVRTGPDGSLTYTCRNVSMTSLTSVLRTLTSVTTNPILDETGLKGLWSFDFSIGGPMAGDQGRRLTIFDSVESLGLKLEKRDVPTPVLVVDSANESPTPNPEGIAEAMPSVKLPTEFEVVSVKMVEASVPGAGPIRTNLLAGGRFDYEGVPLYLLIARALNSKSQIQNMPSFTAQERYDIVGRVNLPPSVNPNDPELTAGLLRSLLTERFNLKYHKEERPVTVYQLAAGKPKLKNADPANRAHCTRGNGPAGSPPGTQVLTCQNVTLQQFADQLQGISPDLVWPVDDSTGVSGNFDITLTFSFTATNNLNMAARGGAPAAGSTGGAVAPDVSDPTGGYTLAEALEKELGLKLEKIKRNDEVYVIDQIDTKPTGN